MKKLLTLICILSISICCFSNNKEKDIEKKVSELLEKMTLDEKIGQMAQITIGPLLMNDQSRELNMDKIRDAIVNYHVGSMLNLPRKRAQTPEFWSGFIKEIQDVATTETRLKIPLIYGLDQIHGATYSLGSTVFPHHISLAATWNPAHARKMGEITAYETRACNVPWTFSPVLDLGADPRFPRQHETFGEDPYMGYVFAKEIIKGLEGDDNDIANPYRIASCLKHFIGYGVPVSGKDRTPANIPYNSLLEYHVPPFQGAIDAGSNTAMINSGIVNNEPVHASYDLLTTLLRKKLGFDGMIVTDWQDIEKLYIRDRMASSHKEAIALGINAGIDMVMLPEKYKEFNECMVELVNEGVVPMSRVDDAVSRILRLKFRLNLFEQPNTNYKNYPKYASDEFAKEAYSAAVNAVTLLKNENEILPLDIKGNGKILLTGPNANSRRALTGGWTISWQGEGVDEYPQYCRTIVDVMTETFGKNRITHIPGVSYSSVVKYDSEHKDQFEEAIEASKRTDIEYIVVCVGENSYSEKPGDLNDLYLHDLQTELVTELLKSGKKIIVVLGEGRPRVISRFSSKVDAIVQTYLPGVHGAQALTDVLTGKENPSGKLPYTYPAFPNSTVPYYHKYADEQKKSASLYNYEGDYNPEYHFGFGLSYTTFAYTNPTISIKKLPAHSPEEIILSVDVTNTGKRDGKEVVQLYSSDLYASLIPDMKRLRRFEKITLKSGETKTVNFRLKTKDLAFYNLKNELIEEAGDFEFLIGASSDDIKATIPFEIIK